MAKSHLYTRTGDAGETSLVGGARASKSSPRLDAYGTVDELNAHLGLLAATAPLPDDSPERQVLTAAQNKMFSIGSRLATAGADPQAPVSGLADADIRALEEAIDRLDALTPPVNRFTLPAGHPAACQAHVARTVCRRAERRVVALNRAEADVPQAVLTYLNRLSDYLYILSRHINHLTATPELYWEP